MPGRDKIKTSGSDFGQGFTPKKKDYVGLGKPSKKKDYVGLGKPNTKKIKQKDDKSDFSGGNKFTPKVTKSVVSKKTDKKPKVITPAMIKAKGFTTLRDYLNNEQGLKRRDGKKVEKITKTTKTSKVVQPPKKAPNRGGNKIVSSMKSSNAGIDGGSSQVNKPKAAKKKSSFFNSIGSGIKKAVKETKRNFEGDFKKKTGRYKLISTGKTNFNKKKK